MSDAELYAFYVTYAYTELPAKVVLAASAVHYTKPVLNTIADYRLLAEMMRESIAGRPEVTVLSVVRLSGDDRIPADYLDRHMDGIYPRR